MRREETLLAQRQRARSLVVWSSFQKVKLHRKIT